MNDAQAAFLLCRSSFIVPRSSFSGRAVNRRSSREPQRGKKARRRQPPRPARSQAAFVCTVCRKPIGDPLYTGPLGHRRRGECLECFLDRRYGPGWRRRKLANADRRLLDMVWLLHQGHGQVEIADRLQCHRNTVARQVERLKRFPSLLSRVVELLGIG